MITPQTPHRAIVMGMTDIIYVGVVVAFFATSELYAHWCEKL